MTCKENLHHLNPLTPMPAISSHDEFWPLFHFWRHHYWPKLVSSILKFYGRKRPFLWYPDQNDELNGAWNMHLISDIWVKNSRAKFLATFCTLSYSMVKIAFLADAFLEIFELEASPVEGQLLKQKDEKRRKRKGEKKNWKAKTFRPLCLVRTCTATCTCMSLSWPLVGIHNGDGKNDDP